MGELIARDDMGVFADTKEVVRADSRDVARLFGKDHKNVLQAIDKIISPKGGHTAEFNRLNFKPIFYTDSMNRKQRAYGLTRDGFITLVFRFNGKKAATVQETYIKRFNAMEEALATLLKVRADFPLLTDAVKNAHKNPRPYHYSNECDMLNRLVLGMSAAQYKKAHPEVPDDASSIRPYLTAEQVGLLDQLQQADIAYLAIWPDDYYARFEALITYLSKHGYEAAWAGPKRKRIKADGGETDEASTKDALE